MTQEDIYSKLYRIAGHILRERNPCDFQEVELLDGTKQMRCVAQRTASERNRQISFADIKYGSCCTTCKNLGPNGCTVESLDCRLYLCIHHCGKPNMSPEQNAAEGYPGTDYVAFISLGMLRRAADEAKMPPSMWRDKSKAFIDAIPARSPR